MGCMGCMGEGGGREEGEGGRYRRQERWGTNVRVDSLEPRGRGEEEEEEEEEEGAWAAPTVIYRRE